MYRILLLCLVLSLSSCFLFSDFRKRKAAFTTGEPSTFQLLVPKKHSDMERIIDTAGNEMLYYKYSNGAVLYFSRMKDTSTMLQYIDYTMNLPKDLYGTRFYKGVRDGYYWRESRFGNYKAGYYGVDPEDDGTFDSSL
ncbi:MAG: hypothetical protein ACXWV3_07580, partial [Flavisolibacter sp.]